MTKPKNTALITGASSGIGKEFALYHAKQGGDLVIVARNSTSLQKLKEQIEDTYKVNVTVITQDLSEPGGPQKIFEQTNAAGLQIDILINNAGFGGHGKFHERPLDQDLNMMQVNMFALVSLTHLYMQGMVQRKNGKILNLASTAALLPGPLQAVYYATKAFVLSFSQAIAQELDGTGVSVTALCPGPVATKFVSSAKLEGVEIFENAASAVTVAKCGYEAMQKGKLVAFNDKSLQFTLNWVVPFLPRKTVLKVSEKSMSKH